MGVAWLTCMQNVGALRMIRECSKDAILKCGLLDAIILGHVKCRQGQKRPELFCQIQLEGLWPDSVILVWILNACASILALKEAGLFSEFS